MFAAAEGHADIVRMLLGKGADPGLMDIDGESAATFAGNNGHARGGSASELLGVAVSSISTRDRP